jgi:hypothetical protein
MRGTAAINLHSPPPQRAAATRRTLSKAHLKPCSTLARSASGVPTIWSTASLTLGGCRQAGRNGAAAPSSCGEVDLERMRKLAESKGGHAWPLTSATAFFSFTLMLPGDQLGALAGRSAQGLLPQLHLAGLFSPLSVPASS